MTYDELKTRMATAAKVFGEAPTAENLAAINAISKEMEKAKASIAKELAEALRKESEALAGKREELAIAIHQQVKVLKLDKAILAVKGWGFTYKIDGAVPNEPDIKYGSVALSTVTIKAPKAGGAGGSKGKTKDEYGMSLSELCNQYGTQDEKDAIAKATSGSSKWQKQLIVKKRVIAEGLLRPAK